MKTREERKIRRKRIKENMKNFFLKIKEWIIKFDDFILPKITETSLTIMNNLKKFIDSDLITKIEDLIPGDLDDKFFAKVKVSIDKVLTEMNIWDECTKEDETLQDKILCFVKHFKTLPKPVQDAYYTQIHTKLIADLDDYKKTLPEYTLQASLDYLEQKINS